jgi:hypothetical protein
MIACIMEKKAFKWNDLVTGLLSGDKGGMAIKPHCRGWLHLL